MHLHSYYKNFVNRRCNKISTKGPTAPFNCFLPFSTCLVVVKCPATASSTPQPPAVLDLFTCDGTLGFDFWVHQSKVRGARPTVEIMCTDSLEGWVSRPTY